MSLRSLIQSHLVRPYRNVLLLVVVLQAVQTFAALTLPTLNANLIDNGVLVGDNAYIRRIGAVMVLFTFVQIVFAAGAVWYGARAAMGFGRDVRRDMFHRVTDYSAREVGEFGAPSLITRITNDVQQVQMLVVLASTMMISAPITMSPFDDQPHLVRGFSAFGMALGETHARESEVTRFASAAAIRAGVLSKRHALGNLFERGRALATVSVLFSGCTCATRDAPRWARSATWWPGKALTREPDQVGTFALIQPIAKLRTVSVARVCQHQAPRSAPFECFVE
jgi:ABC-type multidrug transport system fused ATPase/permease subunit